jgi:tmRNA-binding protein
MTGKDKEKDSGKNKLIAENRRARFDYFLEQTYEAGISLTGRPMPPPRGASWC